MATVRLSPLFNGWQGFGTTGLPLPGGLLNTYAAGTTTPTPTYTTPTGNVQNANPIVLGSDGRPPQEIWLIEGTAYKFVLTDVNSVPIASYDNISGVLDASQNITFSGNPTFTGNVGFSGNGAITTNLPFSGSGLRITGDFSNATIANRLIFQSSTTNGNTDLVAIPNGSSTQSSFNVFNGTDTANSAFGHIAISNGEFSIQSWKTGTGTALPFTFYAGTGEKMRLSTPNGQLLIGTTTESATTGVQVRINNLVQLDNACAFSVHRNGSAYTVNSSAFTLVTYTTKDFDQNTSYDTGTGKFTPPAGKYLLSAAAGQTGGITNQRLVILLYKNGVDFKNASTTVGSASAFGVTSPGWVVDANGTDYFQIYVFQDSGSPISFSGAAVDSYFMGHRIG